MTQNQDANDFKIGISFKIEGYNCRGAAMRFTGIAVTIVTILAKIALIFWQGH